MAHTVNYLSTQGQIRIPFYIVILVSGLQRRTSSYLGRSVALPRASTTRVLSLRVGYVISQNPTHRCDLLGLSTVCTTRRDRSCLNTLLPCNMLRRDRSCLNNLYIYVSGTDPVSALIHTLGGTDPVSAPFISPGRDRSCLSTRSDSESLETLEV